MPTLQRCLSEPGVHVIDVPVDYEENRLFTRELNAHDAKETAEQKR